MTSPGEIRWSEHPEWHDATVALPPPGYRLLDAGSSMLRPARVPHVYTSYSPPEDGYHLRLSPAPPTPTLYNSILGWPIPTQMNPAEMARMNDDFLQEAVPPVDYGRYYGVPFGQVSPSGSHELEVDSAEEAAQLPQVSDSETMPIRVGVTVRPDSTLSTREQRGLMIDSRLRAKFSSRLSTPRRTRIVCATSTRGTLSSSHFVRLSPR